MMVLSMKDKFLSLLAQFDEKTINTHMEIKQ